MHARHAFARYKTMPRPIQYPAFVVGFPRSGTTLLERILSAHPDVVITDEIPVLSEIVQHFSKITGLKEEYPAALLQLDEQKLEALRKGYWGCSQHFGVHCPPHKLQIHKLPLDIRNLGLIHALFPEAKVIVPRRNPQDCILSGYMQTFNFNPAMSHFYSLETIAQLYKDVFSLYQTYKNALPDLQIYEYQYEDLVVDPKKILKEIIQFVGLNWSDDLMNYRESKSEIPIRTPSYKAIQQPIYKTARERWRNYQQYLDTLDIP